MGGRLGYLLPAASFGSELKKKKKVGGICNDLGRAEMGQGQDRKKLRLPQQASGRQAGGRETSRLVLVKAALSSYSCASLSVKSSCALILLSLYRSFLFGLILGLFHSEKTSRVLMALCNMIEQHFEDLCNLYECGRESNTRRSVDCSTVIHRPSPCVSCQPGIHMPNPASPSP